MKKQKYQKISFRIHLQWKISINKWRVWYLDIEQFYIPPKFILWIGVYYLRKIPSNGELEENELNYHTKVCQTSNLFHMEIKSLDFSVW
jgi:hypothetical protein